MDQLWPALGPVLVSTFVGLIVRAHLLDIVVAMIHCWTWLLTLPETANTRAELRSDIAAHIEKQRSHYLNELKLGSAETAIRLVEWQAASMPGDVLAAASATWHRATTAVVSQSSLLAEKFDNRLDETMGITFKSRALLEKEAREFSEHIGGMRSADFFRNYWAFQRRQRNPFRRALSAVTRPFTGFGQQ